jgi:outer membrane protein OmpA-like peptidoglycan-associated protein
MINALRGGLLAATVAVALTSAYSQTDATEIATGPSIDAVGIRVMHAAFQDSSIRLHVAAVDLDGRVPSTSIIGTWTAAVTCRDSVTGVTSDVAPLPRGRDAAQHGVTYVCVDHAAASNGLAKRVVDGFRLLGYGMTERDSVSVIAVDHAWLQLSPLISGTALPMAITDPGPSTGLTALYASLMSAIESASGGNASDRDVVLVTATDDNASIVHDLADVVQRARERNVRISTIRVGQSNLGYVFRYLAGATGGRAMQVHSDSAHAVAQLVRQIVMARRNYIELTVPVPASYAQAPDLGIGVSVTVPGMTLADTVRLPIQARQYKRKRTVLACFSDAADTSLSAYRAQLALLAESLSDDSTDVIDLVGHIEKGSLDAMARGRRRAQRVADALIAQGVSPERITVRSEGDMRPLYAFELMPWQRRLNNRVELRRYKTEPFPYDVVVAMVRTETQADELATTWEGRGFKADVDASVVEGEPLYRVLLWGYASKADAEAAAEVVRTQHDVPTAYVD